MKIKDKIDAINDNTEKILKILNSNAISKAKKYDEIMNHLSNLNIEASLSEEVDYDTGEKYLKISYSISPTTIKLDENKNLIVNDENFKSLNMLNILSISFMEEVSNKIDELKKM